MDETLKIDFTQFESINLAADHWSVGIYLLKKRIPFNYFEDACGMLSQPERFAEIVKGFNMSNFVIAQHLQGLGNSPVIVKKFADIENQQPGFYDEKAEDFCISRLLNVVNEKDLEDIKWFFHCHKLPAVYEKPSVLFMTQFLKTLQTKTIIEQEYLSAALIDYFAKDCNIVVKPHPKDKWINYYKLLPGCTVLPGDVPSELIGLCVNENFDIGLTASSTSIGGIKKCVGRTVSFSTSIETNYMFLHRLYTAASLMHTLFNGDYTYFGQDVCLDQINQMLLTVGEQGMDVKPYDPPFDGTKRCVLVDDLHPDNSQSSHKIMDMLQSFNSGDVAIFLNTQNGYGFYRYADFDVFDDIVPVVISKKIIRQMNFTDEEDEIIYVYTKNKAIKEAVMNFSEQKELQYTGIKIGINHNITADVKLKVLEGKLEAMKKRLSELMQAVYNAQNLSGVKNTDLHRKERAAI